MSAWERSRDISIELNECIDQFSCSLRDIESRIDKIARNIGLWDSTQAVSRAISIEYQRALNVYRGTNI